jgi:UDP-2,3-diacylglucosamine hydrolase
LTPFHSSPKPLSEPHPEGRTTLFEAVFASDLHLHEDASETAQAFFLFLEKYALQTRKLFLLGDLFEYWVGDDEMGLPFNQSIVEAIRKVSDAGVAVFWMAGNRDFLVDEKFAEAARLTVLPDPSVISIASHDIVLTHGDVQCIDDVDYMRFRKMVRSPEWREAFLSRTLSERLETVKVMRDQSRAAQQDKQSEIMDVNADEILALFLKSNTTIMIHGHTHRPAHHDHYYEGREFKRYVLPDWDFEGVNLRGGALAIDASGAISDLSAEKEKVIR